MLNAEELQKVREYLVYKGGLAVEDILRDDEVLQKLGIEKESITAKDMWNVLSGFDWELEYLRKRLQNTEYLLNTIEKDMNSESHNVKLKMTLAAGAYLLGLISSICSIKDANFNLLTAGFIAIGFSSDLSRSNWKKELRSTSEDQRVYQKKKTELEKQIQRRIN